ncbi:hypothetical protein SteCoe_14340 [Stentor coeruleus]|uniref:Aurora kinase n=1 Tax=Stentor coeruleus TaxID=5963 RepID=A0A1R2C683_9CILI|nr:hypothetical protein SteCoe_14340 [Stentor coeruleus]
MGCCSSNMEFVPLPEPPRPVIRSTIKALTRKNSLYAVRLTSITEKYQIIRALGSDSIGTLFHAREMLSGVIRTVREINKFTSTKGVEVFQEYNILRELDHPNIIKIFEAFETPKNFYIVFENVTGGTLLEKSKKLGFEGEFSKYAHELFSALNYMHKQGVIHCNLCPEYIVLSTDDDNAVLKIIGFTLAQKISDKKPIEINKIRIEFASPEVFNNEFTTKSDIWSAGVVLYNILTTRYPFPKGSIEMTIDSISKCQVDYNNSGFASISLQAKNLIKSILVLDPNQRPSCEQLLENPWFYESKQTIPITYNLAKKISMFNIKTTIARCLLSYITSKLSTSKKDFTIINYFKSLDLNNDGKVSKDEILNVFSQVGLNVENEIDFIMENLDYDSSGFIDYTELILALTNWPQELKQKNMVKVFTSNEGLISIDYLKEIVSHIKESEWAKFRQETRAENELITIKNLKEYLKESINI